MKKRKLIRNILLLACVFLFIAWLNVFLIKNSETVRLVVSQFGYAGMFVVAIISGFNVAVPIPVIGFYPLFVELGFVPVFIILTLSLGMTLGNTVGYFVGFAGKGFFERASSIRVRKMFDRLYLRHQSLPFVFLFFYAAFVPLPNELLVIPMAIAGYRFWQMVVVLLIGNIIFNIVGAFGISTIVSFL
ncbi:MAG: hypothetical protein CO029_03340 [Candidatus Magasanikbacteria bacterium CG_4_9_14_0_2_um_filter_41_10]|uniref:TVP38/TMEM64 family membrane protein n=1 Tax=Candidatus Magasanikbacteria bacterium CG_4_10_14_0_2_um_filter_41_31 TaxID=1974639 RepID=A0A2M7V4Q3_9BACT|nr:MAG: hypothetical protein AUJ37_04540 [Candidatus Magasanikbacteria bacterium CG1_02_41_34]PIZ93554.1 MAG: hypothetical protein COX83_01660 [Candidatus Magasanikbacteria bacterium CG_4_10_14_0_2_um_filter_41_31]PJC53318.1 MAG: hypothetical protein CO029_03340 [Candidatus Magasanikbacteria bacterium CG_4_9_14_0_2_um_filter_41_10]